MIRGLYIAASAAISETKRVDVISNNMANANTIGYKKDTMITESFPNILMKRIGATDYRDIAAKAPITSKIGYIGKMNNGVRVDEVFTNFEQGPISVSGSPLDLALQGNGFFSIETPAGERYTRSGEFTIDSEGYITTQEGYKVLGQNGPIQADGKNIVINENGQVFSDGNEIDTLKLVDFNDYKLLKKQGESLYLDSSDDAENMKDAEGLVLQGAVESSNVNSVKVMVEMITMLRSYEANQKVIKTFDDLLGKSVSEFGRV
jgi:flagellar basal-body rod protein FlgG